MKYDLEETYGRTTVSYISDHSRKLLERIQSESFDSLTLMGFSDSMKWLTRLFKEDSVPVTLCDWRPRFVEYDCVGEIVQSFDSQKGQSDSLWVICCDSFDDISEATRFILESGCESLPIIYETDKPHNAFRDEHPFSLISSKAMARAPSMLLEVQLFDLIQLVQQTAHLDGDILEFGSFQGGSGAIIAEAVNHFDGEVKRKVKLFDSFEGIPKSRYGLDHRWTTAFMNNSFREVTKAVDDLDFVEVLRGNIMESHIGSSDKISICYIASDTLETGEALLNFAWPRLQTDGMIVICDYCSLPNCFPLTVLTEKFLESHPRAFSFRTSPWGIFIMKR